MANPVWHALAWAAQQAQTGAAPGGAAGGPAGPAGPGGLFSNPIVPMLGVIVIMFYFMILRPQKTEQKKREALLNSLAKGDRVITSGGIHGTVEEVAADKATVIVGVAPKVSLRVSRTAIGTVVKKKSAEESGEDK